MLARSVFVVVSFLTIVRTVTAQDVVTPSGELLPGTTRLEWTNELHEVMVRGINRFAERELAASRGKRNAPWLTAENPQAEKTAARQRLREIIGVVDELKAHSPLFTRQLSEIDWDTIPIELTFPDSKINSVKNQELSNESLRLEFEFLVEHWDVCDGVSGAGLFMKRQEVPSKRDKITDRSNRFKSLMRPVFVVLGDPASNAFELMGTTVSDGNKNSLATELAKLDAEFHCPVLIDRGTQFSGHTEIRQTNLSHREYVYRLGFELGRHVVGYEVQRVLSLLRAIRPHSANTGVPPVILVGVGEGALIAQYVAALDPDLVDAVVLHGYFGPRERVWEEPIYRNVWNQLSEFGDAEIASLIAPTPLIIEAGVAPEVNGPPEPQKGQAAIAAPGVISSPKLDDVRREFERAKSYYKTAEAEEQLKLVEKPQTVCGPETIRILNEVIELNIEPNTDMIVEPSYNKNPQDILQERLVGELVRHTQMLLARADKVRAKLWKDVDRTRVEAWEKQAEKYRELVHSSFIGKLDPPKVFPNPRSRKVIDEPTHVGYEIALDVYPTESPTEDDPGVIAGGILLLPNDLKEGEQRPVVVCQHGLEGTPMDTITLDESQRAFRAYKGFSTQLVKLGFIVYAPQNPYKGRDDFRVIQRKSNPLGRSLFSYIIEQHRQTLKWLSSLPYVDPQRIAFYGLSYGGKTAVRVPPLLVPNVMDNEAISDSRWNFLIPGELGNIDKPNPDLHLFWSGHWNGVKGNGVEVVGTGRKHSKLTLQNLKELIRNNRPKSVCVVFDKSGPADMTRPQAIEWLNDVSFRSDVSRVVVADGTSQGNLILSNSVNPKHFEPGYCLSICSADFNEWIRKNASAEDRYSYVYTPEYEIFEWNMGHIANYAELSWLMAPRPFMVERGHDDGVAPDEWVGWEYAKVRRHYTKLGIGDRSEIEWFDGPHTINGKGTFEFLSKHLNWSIEGK